MVGKNLKEIRERKALSIRELARISGVATATIVRIENTDSKTQPTTLQKLADALNISVEKLTKGL